MSTKDPASALRNALRREMKTLANPTRAIQQQAYMKSAMPYLGLTAPELTQLLKTLLPAHPLPTEALWQTAVLHLWRKATHREERYAAVALAEYRPYKAWLTPQAVPMLEEMVVTGAWWDFVDHLATRHFFKLRTTHRKEVHKLMRQWARDPDIWRRRVAILFQLKARADTDEALLFHAIEYSMGEKEFFLRKAIGVGWIAGSLWPGSSWLGRRGAGRLRLCRSRGSGWGWLFRGGCRRGGRR